MAKILIVDDRATDRLLLVTLLGYQGHACLEAADGEQGLRLAKAERPDLVICDLLMPRMDGYEFIRQLRADPAVAATPVIFYTATYDTAQGQALAEAAGITTFLVKASEPEVILQKVNDALGGVRPAAAPVAEEFDHEHARVVSDKLFEKALELEASNRQLTALLERLEQQAADLRREVAERKRAEEEVRRQREWLHVTLSSIGDAVIATDPAGKVLFMNAVAEELTGWREADAAGVPLAEVFRIRNEETRQAVDCPVALVLRHGVKQGLANHAVLVAKDGSERPIDDCAAPIRDENGTYGVVVIFHDVTERRRLEAQLRERADRLAEADRRKTQFLAMLAHELRNPLGPIRNGLHVLRLSGADAPAREQVRGMMERQVRHMARMIDDLLDVSRLSRGKVPLTLERVDLARLLRLTAEDHRGVLTSGGLAFDVGVPAEPVWVVGDFARLTQVFGNLLDNARKFTPRGGRVSLRLSGGGRAEVVVADTGVGIAGEDLPHLFEPFAQGDQSLDRSSGGLGLGLAVVRGLVGLHGGTIEARSEGPGRGAAFVVRLPLGAEAVAPPEPPAEAPAPAGRRGRLLVIEDSADAAESLRLLLNLEGYEVSVARDGPTGVQAARDTGPDIIVCDVGLPGMDGFKVAEALRQDLRTSGARLIALTGYGREEDRQRALASGFDAHLVKPVDPDKLLEAITAAAG